MTYKEKLAKKKALFSLKNYLQKKAQYRADLLQARAAKKEHKHDHKHDHALEPIIEDVVEIEELKSEE